VQRGRSRRQLANLLGERVQLLAQDRKLAPGFLGYGFLPRWRERIESRKGLAKPTTDPAPLLLELRRNSVGDPNVARREQAEKTLVLPVS
jgi:hypothetical protein